MPHASAEAVIPVAQEDVFDLLADVRNEARWHPDYRGAEKLTEGDVGQGTRFAARYRGLGPTAIEITGYERPSRLDFAAGSRGMEMTVRFRFAAVSGGTRISSDVDASFRGALRLAGPLFGPMLRREVARRPKQIMRAFEPSA